MDYIEVFEIENKFLDVVMKQSSEWLKRDGGMDEEGKMFFHAFEAVQDLRKYLQKGGEGSGRGQAEDTGSVAPGIAGNKEPV